MKVTKDKMQDALPILQRASLSVDVLMHLVDNKDRLSLDKHVSQHLEQLVGCVAKLQDLMYDNEGYRELFARTLAHVSRDREYEFQVVENAKGRQYFNVDAMLPLDEMKGNVVLTGGDRHYVITVHDMGTADTRAADDVRRARQSDSAGTTG